MKYLIYRGLGVVMFDDRFKHSQVAYDLNDVAYGVGNEIVAGGVVNISSVDSLSGFDIECSGSAEGIKGIESRGVEDELLISQMFDKQSNERK